MSYEPLDKPYFIWTRDRDVQLRDLLHAGWTYSGCAEVLGARRVEVEARAAKLFGPISTGSTSRAAVMHARARAA